MARIRALVVEDNEDDELLLLRIRVKSGLDTHFDIVRDGRIALDHLTFHEAKFKIWVLSHWIPLLGSGCRCSSRPPQCDTHGVQAYGWTS